MKETKQAFDGRFAREMTETAKGMRRFGVMDEATHSREATCTGWSPSSRPTQISNSMPISMICAFGILK